MSGKLFICSFRDKVIADGAAKLLDEQNINFMLKEEDGAISLYADEKDEERILKIVRAYEKTITDSYDKKGFLKRFFETAVVLIGVIVFLTVYVYGIDKIINFIKNFF